LEVRAGLGTAAKKLARGRCCLLKAVNFKVPSSNFQVSTHPI
jgi:hypothetical protein